MEISEIRKQSKQNTVNMGFIYSAEKKKGVVPKYELTGITL